MSIEDSDKEFDYYISRADEYYAVGFIEKGNTEVVSIIEQEGDINNEKHCDSGCGMDC